MRKLFSILLGGIVALTLSLLPVVGHTAEKTKTVEKTKTATKTKVLFWSGCGISKKAFMKELAKAYKDKTGVEIKLTGGGATKGIRNVATYLRNRLAQ